MMLDECALQINERILSQIVHYLGCFHDALQAFIPPPPHIPVLSFENPDLQPPPSFFGNPDQQSPFSFRISKRPLWWGMDTLWNYPTRPIVPLG